MDLESILSLFLRDPMKYCANMWNDHALPVLLAIALVAIPSILRTLWNRVLQRAREATDIKVVRRLNVGPDSTSKIHKSAGTHAHFLDLSPEFIQEAEKSVRLEADSMQVKIMPLSTYLRSLQITPESSVGDLAVRASLRLLVELMGPQLATYLLPFLPRIGEDIVAPQVHKLPAPPSVGKVLGDFPSLLVGAAAIDVISRKDLIEGSGMVSACDIMATGEESDVSPALPELPSRLVLKGPESIDELVNTMDLGEHPDVKHYETPRPFAPDLLPDLCLGWGGLTPYLTPREHARHRLIACIFNKLAANVLSIAGFRWEKRKRKASPKSQASEVPDFQTSNLDDIQEQEEIGDEGDEIDPFVLTIQNGPNGKPIDVFTPWELVDLLVEDDSYDCWFQTNHTSFGLSLCVLHPELGKLNSAGSSSTDPEDHKKYSQIPLSPCARSDLLDVESGEPLKQLGIHSSLVLKADNHPILGTFHILFYTGVEGFSGFHRNYRYEMPWVTPVTHRQNNKRMTKSEMVDVVKYATMSAVVNNACAKRLKLPNGGYGSVGVCNDSTAALQMALWGKCTIFPLLGRSPAKSTILHFAKNELFPKLLSPTPGFVARLASLSSTPMGAEQKEKQLRAVARDALETIVRSLVLLPQDLQVEPKDVPDALRRLQDCTSDESPFLAVKELASKLPKVSRQWENLLDNGCGESYFG